MYTFRGWVTTPENAAARSAVECVAGCFGATHPHAEVNPLLLHGPPGVGKTHLIHALADEVSRRRPDAALAIVSANTWAGSPEEGSARDCGLLAVEDVQHLPPRTAETFTALLDQRGARRRQTVLTASTGPAGLTHLPARLTSRLAAGLVVGLLPFTPEGRLNFLTDRCRRAELDVGEEVLRWLAERLPGSGRQLEGAVARLTALANLDGRAPNLEAVREAFESDAVRPTVERIAERVSDYFRVAPRLVRSPRRNPSILWPRQVGMYLARELTPLSLAQIGAYFGGRDHSTVLHACRKVEEALGRDAGLVQTLRSLRADLA
jgi:chromosomal replication initiator protein